MDHILRKKGQPYAGQPELDRYSQAERKKTLGYPKGQNTMFLDGRLLRDCIFPRADGAVQPAPGGVPDNNVANLNWQEGGIIPDDRACYIMGVSAGPNWDVHINMWVAWQIWANGKYLDGSVVGKWYHPVKKYLPPRSVATIYVRGVNNGGIGVARINWSLQFVTFNATLDIWDLGRANLQDNPTVIAVWP